MALALIAGLVASCEPAHAATDARALALDGVCVAPKPVAVPVPPDDAIVCLGFEASAEPAVFGTALRKPRRR